jgi:hypothetical protein
MTSSATLGEEGGWQAELLAKSDRPSHDHPQDIALLHVAGQDPVSNQEDESPPVISNHPVRYDLLLHLLLGVSGQGAQALKDRLKQIRVIVAGGVLQDGNDALQAHPCIYARLGERSSLS